MITRIFCSDHEENIIDILFIFKESRAQFIFWIEVRDASVHDKSTMCVLQIVIKIKDRHHMIPLKGNTVCGWE